MEGEVGALDKAPLALEKEAGAMRAVIQTTGTDSSGFGGRHPKWVELLEGRFPRGRQR